MRSLFTYSFLLLSSLLFSQEVTKEMRMKYVDQLTREQLKPAIHDLYAAKTDEQRKELNKKVFSLFEEAIRTPYTFDYGFDSLKNDIGVVYSPDDKFRIIHWDLKKDDGTFEYYGFLQADAPKDKADNDGKRIFILNDKSAEIRNPENTICTPEKWFGMLYYKIIIKKTKSKTYYTLLGRDGNDKFTQKKVIDVLTFDDAGNPKFGADIFSFQKRYPKRVIFEYSSSCVMSLKYSRSKDSIIFEHLAPTHPSLEGQFQYYCGDMSYDGFGFKKGKWNYGADVQAFNEKTDNDKYYGDPHDKKEGHDESHPLNPRDKDIKKEDKKKNLEKEKKKKKS